MPKVLTTASTLVCAHQGIVQLTASQNLLKVDGHAVLVRGDLNGALINGCTTPQSQNTQPCTLVVSMSIGAATKLMVGGRPVLLEIANGITNGITPAPPTNFWRVQSAGQTKLGSI